MSSSSQSFPLERCLSPGLYVANASAQEYCAYTPQWFFPNPAQTYLILLCAFLLTEVELHKTQISGRGEG